MCIEALKFHLRIIVIFALLIGGAGCGEGKPPYAMVHMCVINDEGVSLFKNLMREIAISEKMEFVDGSARTDRELKIIDPEGRHNFINGGIVNVGIQGNGIGLGATNLGLMKYQIVVGFSGNEEKGKMDDFVDKVVGVLSKYWSVEFVPSDRGVFKMDKCGDELR